MRFDWEHLKSWIFGLLGGSAAILLVVVAANSPTQSNSKPAGAPQSQSAAPATKAQASTPLAASQPVAPQTSSITDNAAKASAPPKPVPVTTTVEAAKEAGKPAPMKDHATVMAQAEPTAPARAPSLPEKPQPVAAAAGLQGDADAGARFSRNVRPVILWSRERPFWVQALPGSSAASRRPTPISAIRRP
ncbi:hypothetical protein [Bradyrhizobium sp.]|uniref:hypothetical protein n=1 Tax=Bradyrhizobium sp. TaxID=376 RepID=UPI003BAE7616